MKICTYALAGTLIAATGASELVASTVMACDREADRADAISFSLTEYDVAFQRARLRFAQDQSKDALDEYEYANFQLHLRKSELNGALSEYASCLLNVIWELEDEK